MEKRKSIKKEVALKDIDNQELVEKIIDLCLWYHIEDSHRRLEMINLQIKNCNLQIEFLLDNKPFWFQKQKLEEHNKKIEELENKIIDYYKQIEEEVDIIQKMQQSLNKEGDIISYNKLIELLSNNVAPYEVELNLGNKYKNYILLEEGYYVLKNKKPKDEMFSYWLRDCLLDNENDKKCIKIIKYKKHK
ncbi:MAG: hypothetical protein Q4G04_06560 [bacterium]|nr:hypothetical protein [bacterium]